MSAPALLAELAELGVELRLEGTQVRYRPASKVPPALLSALRSQRDQVLVELRARGEPPRPPTDSLGIEHQAPRASRVEPTAYLVYSRLLKREVWLCRDDQTAAEIAAEGSGVPCLTFDEVPLLRGKPVELLRAVFDAKAVFVGARLDL